MNRSNIPENIWAMRGEIIEAYVWKDLSVFQLSVYYKVSLPIINYLIQLYEDHTNPVLMQIDTFDDEPNLDKDNLHTYMLKCKMQYFNKQICIHGSIAAACKAMGISRKVFYDTNKLFNVSLKKHLLHCTPLPLN